MTRTTSIDLDLGRAAVGAAVRAPSVYNAQPWRFALRDGVIDVRIDANRVAPIADPRRWAARIACGAAITNLRLSLAVAGLDSRAHLLPAPDDPLLVAIITGTGPCTPTPRQRSLYAAIPRRQSNRRPFFDAPVPADVRARMQGAAAETGTWLSLVEDRDSVVGIAEIVRVGDQWLRSNAAYVAEMKAWIDRYKTADGGIPPEAAGTAPAGQDLMAMRDFGGADRAEGRDFESDPLLAVLGTHGHSQSHDDDLVAGMALQMVLLTATDARLATSLLSQPIEIPDFREDLRRSLRRLGTPQMIIRVGYGQPVRSTARRPVDDFIDMPT